VLTPSFTNPIELCNINQGYCQHVKKLWASRLWLQKGHWVPHKVPGHGHTQQQQQQWQGQLQWHNVTINLYAKDKRRQLMTGG
jgi:hypothetical protein